MRKLAFLIAFMVCILFCGANKGVASAAEKYNSTNIAYETADKYIINSKLTYPNVKKSHYPMVVMLHSLGYSSVYWETLVDDFLHAGIAVLEIDMKGHGKSSSDIYFKRRSWIYLDDKDYQSYPDEVLDIVYNVLDSYDNIAPSYITYLGADIGANTAIWVAAKQRPYPLCLVLISPHIDFKGLYTPIKLADAGKIPVMAAAAMDDLFSVKQVDELEKFAQGLYDKKIYPNGGTGMLMIKVNPQMPIDIVNWVVKQVNEFEEKY